MNNLIGNAFWTLQAWQHRVVESYAYSVDLLTFLRLDLKEAFVFYFLTEEFECWQAMS